jgi:hypothetical protein
MNVHQREQAYRTASDFWSGFGWGVICCVVAGLMLLAVADLGRLL